LSASFNNKVQQILLNFNNSSNLNITIKDAADATNPRLAAVQGSTITLNSYALINASQELVAAVIYHEVLHIYIGNTAVIDHNTMSTKYVQPMASALQAWVPLSNAEAAALAWTGLQGTAAWNNINIDERNNMLGLINIHQNHGNNCN
jgi:hypothetical protein